MSPKAPKLLIIDDDDLFRDAASSHLERRNFEVVGAGSAQEALQMCRREEIDIALLDQKLPDGRGADICSSILAYNDRTKIIFITAYPSYENALEAIKFGVHDYLSKPVELQELDLAVGNALRTLELERLELIQNYRNRKELEQTVLIGAQSGLKDVDHLISLAASSEAPVLITGETGTGKNLVAKTIHFRSTVNSGPFVSINCASLPENLIEAELFGHEKGAFTGATASKKGIFEMAAGGSLFLDEIGELPLHLQSKLLGALDEKKIKRIGGHTLRPVEGRIVAATNLDLDSAIENRAFRSDLYYRLSVLRIHLPPLRDHIEDLPKLCRSFLNDIAPSASLHLGDGEVEKLMAYRWPGNVRELRNVIERSVILRRTAVLHPSRLLHSPCGAAADPSPAVESRPQTESGASVLPLKEIEKEHIRSALRAFDHNHSQSARALGISRSTLMRKIKAYHLGSGSRTSDADPMTDSK